MLQKVHIKQSEKEPHKVEILVDGVNITNRICGYKLTQETGSFPVFEVRSINGAFEYEGLADVIGTKEEENRSLKKELAWHKKAYKLLNAKLDEYEKTYGRL